MSQGTVIIITSSTTYREHCDKIVDTLDRFGVASELRVASAYKATGRLLAILGEYESDPAPHVYLIVSEHSNALAGLADSHVRAPVIICPAPGCTIELITQPEGISPMLVMGADNAAVAAVKVLAIADPDLQQKLDRYQQASVYRLVSADAEINRDTLQ